MHKAIATLENMSPYGQSKMYTKEEVPPLDEGRESNRDYEIRTWRERCHRSADGKVEIPPMAFHNALIDASQYTGKKIPGQGQKTWTAKFRSGIMCKKPLVLPVNVDDVEGLWLHVPSDGRRGGSKRVPKCFPVIYEWRGNVEFHILDEIITKEVFAEQLREAGKFIGIGFFRPQRNGYFGRFLVKKIAWT